MNNNYTVLDRGLNVLGVLSLNNNSGNTTFWGDTITQQIADDGQSDDPTTLLSQTMNAIDANANHKLWNHTINISFEESDSVGKPFDTGYYLLYQDVANNKLYLMNMYDVTEDGTGDTKFKTANGNNSAIYDASHAMVTGKTFTNVNLSTIVKYIADYIGWSFIVNSDDSVKLDTYTIDDNATVMAIIQDLIVKFDTEVDAYVTLDAGRIQKRIIEFGELGTNNGQFIAYGAKNKGFESITQQWTSDTVYTKVHVKGANDSTFASINQGNDFIVDDEANGLYNPVNASLNVPRYLETTITNELLSEPTALLNWAKKQLPLLNHPRANYTVSTLHDMVGSLGDIIKVQDRTANPVITLNSRIIQKVTSFASPETNQFTLGEFSAVSFRQTLATQIYTINTNLDDVRVDAENAVTKATDAETASLQATKDASVANEMAEVAHQMANDAQTSASNAQADAKIAQESADSAKTSADNAQKDADTANSMATVAKTSADNAISSATLALQDAKNAKSSADIAKASADSANSLATKASDDLVAVKSDVNKAYDLANSAQVLAGVAQKGVRDGIASVYANDIANIPTQVTIKYSDGTTDTRAYKSGDNAYITKDGVTKIYTYDGSKWVQPDGHISPASITTDMIATGAITAGLIDTESLATNEAFISQLVTTNLSVKDGSGMTIVANPTDGLVVKKSDGTNIFSAKNGVINMTASKITLGSSDVASTIADIQANKANTSDLTTINNNVSKAQSDASTANTNASNAQTLANKINETVSWKNDSSIKDVNNVKTSRNLVFTTNVSNQPFAPKFFLQSYSDGSGIVYQQAWSGSDSGQIATRYFDGTNWMGWQTTVTRGAFLNLLENNISLGVKDKAGDVISGLNAGADGSLKLKGSVIELNGNTKIDGDFVVNGDNIKLGNITGSDLADKVNNMQTGANILTNTEFSPDFQGWYGNNADNHLDTIANDTNTRYETVTGYNGSRGLRLIRENGATINEWRGANTDMFPVKPGDVISESAWVYVNSLGSDSTLNTVYFEGYWYKSDYSRLPPFTINCTIGVSEVGRWHAFKMENVVAPAGAAYMQLHFLIRGKGDAVLSQPMLNFGPKALAYSQGTYNNNRTVAQVSNTAKTANSTANTANTNANKALLEISNGQIILNGNTTVNSDFVVNGSAIIDGSLKATKIDTNSLLTKVFKTQDATITKQLTMGSDSTIGSTGLIGSYTTYGRVSTNDWYVSLDSPTTIKTDEGYNLDPLSDIDFFLNSNVLNTSAGKWTISNGGLESMAYFNNQSVTYTSWKNNQNTESSHLGLSFSPKSVNNSSGTISGNVSTTLGNGSLELIENYTNPNITSTGNFNGGTIKLTYSGADITNGYSYLTPAYLVFSGVSQDPTQTVITKSAITTNFVKTRKGINSVGQVFGESSAYFLGDVSGYTVGSNSIKLSGDLAMISGQAGNTIYLKPDSTQSGGMTFRYDNSASVNKHTIQLTGAGATLKFVNDASGSSDWNGAATVTADKIASTSTRDSKVNVEDITDDDIDKILSLRPRTFNRKGSIEAAIQDIEGTNKSFAESDLRNILDKEYGFIIEELQEIGLQGLFSYDDFGNAVALSYDRITALLLAAIQKQRSEKAELELQVAKMQGQINKILEKIGD